MEHKYMELWDYNKISNIHVLEEEKEGMVKMLSKK